MYSQRSAFDVSDDLPALVNPQAGARDVADDPSPAGDFDDVEHRPADVALDGPPGRYPHPGGFWRSFIAVDVAAVVVIGALHPAGDGPPHQQRPGEGQRGVRPEGEGRSRPDDHVELRLVVVVITVGIGVGILGQMLVMLVAVLRVLRCQFQLFVVVVFTFSDGDLADGVGGSPSPSGSPPRRRDERQVQVAPDRRRNATIITDISIAIAADPHLGLLAARHVQGAEAVARGAASRGGKDALRWADECGGAAAAGQSKTGGGGHRRRAVRCHGAV